MNETRRDMLIALVAEGRADAPHWDELIALAHADAAVWREVVEAQRDQVALERTMAVAAGVADRVAVPAASVSVAVRAAGAAGQAGLAEHAPTRSRSELDGTHHLPIEGSPEGTPDRSPGRSSDRSPDRSRQHDAPLRLVSWFNWSGWAVAALVLIALAVQLFIPFSGRGETDPTRSPGTQNPGAPAPVGAVVPVSTAADAFKTYMDLGREEGLVLSDEPRRLLIRTRPVASGDGFELIYVQQIVERTFVPDLFELRGRDEQGRPAILHYRPGERGSADEM